MNWMAWTALAFALSAVICFCKGSFGLSWDALPWLFWCAISVVAAIAFGLCAIFA